MSKDYDPRMHSAEHILNQTMVRMFQCGRSFSAHIEKKKSKCDYHFNRPLQDTEVQEIEKQVNSVIANALPITQEFITRAEAEQFLNLEKLPDDAGENIRVIKIGDYDTCPCIGLHAANTEEIGSFSIISTSYENDVLRIRFKIGKQ